MNYQLLFDYMSKQHGVDLLETDMIEIVRIVNEIQKPDEPQAKTIREWFEELPEPYRGEALEFMKFPAHITQSMSDAIMDGLYWNETKSGLKYWDDFYEEIRGQNK